MAQRLPTSEHANDALANPSMADDAMADDAMADSSMPGPSTADSTMANIMSNLTVSEARGTKRRASDTPLRANVHKIVKDTPVLANVDKTVKDTPVLANVDKTVKDTPVLANVDKTVKDTPVLANVDKTVKDIVDGLLADLQQEEDENDNIEDINEKLYGRICELEKLKDLLDKNCVKAKGPPKILKSLQRHIASIEGHVKHLETTHAEEIAAVRKEYEEQHKNALVDDLDQHFTQLDEYKDLAEKNQKKIDQLTQQLEEEKTASQEKDLDYATALKSEQNRHTAAEKNVFNLHYERNQLQKQLAASQQNVLDLQQERINLKNDVEAFRGQHDSSSAAEQLQNDKATLEQKVKFLEDARQQDSKNYEQALNIVKAERDTLAAKATNLDAAEWQKTAFKNYKDKMQAEAQLVETRKHVVTAQTEAKEANGRATALTKEKNELQVRGNTLAQQLNDANTAYQNWQNERTTMMNVGRDVVQERDTAVQTAKNVQQEHDQIVGDLMNEGRELERKYNEQCESNKNWETSCNNAITERDLLQSRCNDLAAQLNELVEPSKQIQEYETRCNAAIAERDTLLNQKNGLATQLEQSEVSRRTKEEELLSTKESLKNLKGKLDQLKKTKEDEVLSAQKSLNDSRRALDHLKKMKEDEVLSAQKPLNDARRALDQLKKNNRNLEEKCTKTSNQLSVREQDYSTLQSEHRATKTELYNSRQNLKKASEEALVKEQHIEGQNSKVSELEQKLESETNHRSKLEAQAKEEEENLTKAYTEVSSVTRKNKKLNRDMKELKSSLSAKGKAIDDLKDQNSKLIAEKKAAEDNNTPLEEHKKAVDAQVKKIRLNIQPSLGDHKRLQEQVLHLETEARKLATQLLSNPNADHLATAVDFMRNVLEEDCDVDEVLTKRQIIERMNPKSAAKGRKLNARSQKKVPQTDIPVPIKNKAGVNETSAEDTKIDHGLSIEDIPQDRPLGEQLHSAAPSMATTSLAAEVQALKLAPLPISTTRLRSRCGLPRYPEDDEKNMRIKLEKLDWLMRKSNGEGLPKLSNPNEMMWDATMVDRGSQTESAEETKAGIVVVEIGTQTEAMEQINVATNVVNDGPSDKISPSGKEIAIVDSSTQTEITEQTKTVAKIDGDESMTSNQGSETETSDLFKITAPTSHSIGPGALHFLSFLAVLFAFLCAYFYYMSHVRLEEVLNRGDEYTRLAILSIRAGGGTGSAVPSWFWDDGLLEHIPGLYG